MGQATDLMNKLNEDDINFMEKLIVNAKQTQQEKTTSPKEIIGLTTGNAQQAETKADTTGKEGLGHGEGIDAKEFEDYKKRLGELEKTWKEVKEMLLKAQAQGKGTIIEPKKDDNKERLREIFKGTGLLGD